MTTIYEFLNAWRELITKVFGEHTLAAALITLLAIRLRGNRSCLFHPQQPSEPLPKIVTSSDPMM